MLDQIVKEVKGTLCITYIQENQHLLQVEIAYITNFKKGFARLWQ